jgi:hypothetical protein
LSYNPLPRVLALDNFPSQTDGNQTVLVLNQIGGDLQTSAGRVGALFGVLYDDQEVPLSFSFTVDQCQSRGLLGQSFRVVGGGLNQAVPSGHSGWLRLWGANDIGLLGAVINFNPNAGASSFNQGHNLHQLTFTTTASLTIPIIPPACQ